MERRHTTPGMGYTVEIYREELAQTGNPTEERVERRENDE